MITLPVSDTSHSLQHQLELATEQCVQKARQAYPQGEIRPVDVRCDLKGSLAGQYRAADRVIRYNMHIAKNQFDAFVQRTVVHEVAHHVVEEVWGQGQVRFRFLPAVFASKTRPRIRPHGRQWREVMTALGASDLNRCHNYHLEGVAIKRQKRHEYQCECRQHLVSSTRHNRMRRGVQYHCTQCRQSLRQIFT